MRQFLLVLVVCYCNLSLVAFGQEQPYPLAVEKLFFDECPAFSEDMQFDCYRDFAELEVFLKDVADQYPGLTNLSSLGKSFQGRDLWLLTITNFETGPPESKPALWVDGGVDSDEVVSTEAALGLIHRLVTSGDEEIKTLLDKNTFYVVPNIIPDMSELHHRSPVRPRDSTMKPWDDDNDGSYDEDPPEDLDGDNEALQMRVIDSVGRWVEDEQDSRLMRRRKLGDAGPFYSLYGEGIDNDRDGRYNEDWPGGIDPNRNYPGNWSASQNGAGPYPGSEVELRVSLDFIQSHPNIAGSQHLHSSGGVILRPPSVPDLKLPASDRTLYLAVAEKGLEITEYPLATSVYDWNWPRGSKNTKRGQLWRSADGEIKGVEAARFGGNYYGLAPEDEDNYAAYGGSIDGMYLLFGVLSFANEIYTFGEDTNGDGTISNAERLAYQDEYMDGQVFREWMPFDHPELGPVEIGGWRKFGQNNPLAPDLQREVDRNVDFILLQAQILPDLEVSEIEQEKLDEGIYRIRATIVNLGFQPTELAIRRQAGRATSVKTSIELESGLVLSEEAVLETEFLDGQSEQELSWLIRADAGTTVEIKTHHPKAGSASKAHTLKD